MSLKPDFKNLGSGVPSLMAADKLCPLLQPSLLTGQADTRYLSTPLILEPFLRPFLIFFIPNIFCFQIGLDFLNTFLKQNLRTGVICLTAVQNRLICGQVVGAVLLGVERDTVKNVGKS